MATFNIYEAKAKLSDLVARAAAGEEIVLAKNGKPTVKLIALGKEKMTSEECARARGYGVDEGLGWIADDFDAPLSELEEFFS